MTKRKMEISSSECPSGNALASLDQARLVELALRGDEAAYEVLVNRYSPMVISLLYSKTGNLADAEDLSQEVFLAAYRHLAQLRNPNHFHAWLTRIAKAKFADFCRQNSRRPIEIHSQEAEDEIIERIPDGLPDPSQVAHRRQIQQIVLREINSLGEKYRAVLYWKLIRHESSSEVADRLGLSPKAVSMAFFRGLRSLRTALEKFGIHSSGVK